MNINNAPHFRASVDLAPPISVEHDTAVSAGFPDNRVGAMGLPEVSQPDNFSDLFEATLKPEILATERARLLQEEADPNFEGRHVSAWRAGFMEGNPRSRMISSSDPVSVGLLKGIQGSPKLPQREFINKKDILEIADEDRMVAIERGRLDPAIELPLDNFVYAEGFVSWREGRRDRDKSESVDGFNRVVRTSAETIVAYKERTTEAPPIGAVTGYVQPNGMILFVTEQGSHRTAAAIARGDRTIKTGKLTLVRLRENYVIPGAVPERILSTVVGAKQWRTEQNFPERGDIPVGTIRRPGASRRSRVATAAAGLLGRRG